MIASSAALAISGIPFQGPIAASRVGFQRWKMFIKSITKRIRRITIRSSSCWNQRCSSMVESETSGLTEKEMLEAVKFGHEKFNPIIKAIENLKKSGKPKWKIETKDHSSVKKKIAKALETRS